MFSVLLAFGLAGAPLPASITPAPCAIAGGCADRLSAADVFAVADRYLSAGKLDDAETLLRGLTTDGDADARAEARFRLAMLREGRGDRREAVELYKALLDEKPDAARPRLELARLLAAQGDEAGARRELRRAGAAGLPDDVARVVDRFATALRSSKPLGGSIEVAVAPDSNINRATDRDTVDTVIAPLLLSPDARSTSGIGLTLSAQGYWRADVSDRVAILSRLSARGDLYGASRFNDVVASVASGPEFLIGGTRVRPAGTYSRRWFGGDVYSDSFGGSLNLLRPLDSVSQIEVEATVLRNDYRFIPEQDGTLIDGNVAYDRAFSPRFSGRIGIRVTRQSADEPSLATTSAGFDLVASRAFGKQLLFVQIGGSRLWSDARIALFPEARRDTRYDLTAGLLLRRFSYRGLSPVIRVSRSVNDSTVGIYDFKRVRFELALSREF